MDDNFEKPRYFFLHSGSPNQDMEYLPHFNRSGSVTVDTDCKCTTGKTIRYYFDWLGSDNDEDTYRTAIEQDLINRFNNRFIHCDLCEERILSEIEADYV